MGGCKPGQKQFLMTCKIQTIKLKNLSKIVEKRFSILTQIQFQTQISLSVLRVLTGDHGILENQKL